MPFPAESGQKSRLSLSIISAWQASGVLFQESTFMDLKQNSSVNRESSDFIGFYRIFRSGGDFSNFTSNQLELSLDEE